jgi:hypothetical protein
MYMGVQNAVCDICISAAVHLSALNRMDSLLIRMGCAHSCCFFSLWEYWNDAAVVITTVRRIVRSCVCFLFSLLFTFEHTFGPCFFLLCSSALFI